MLAAALMAGAVAPAVAAAPLAERVPDVATRSCVDMLSRAVPVPGVGAEGDRVFARYGLTSGVPQTAMDAIGTPGLSLIARATLASGQASDGAFIVALGGAAGETCRIIVYRAPLDRMFVQGAVDAMKGPGRDWRSLPVPAQPAGMLRLSLLKRDAAKSPYLANVLAPVVGSSPVAMIVNVAAIPPNVTLPQGF